MSKTIKKNPVLSELIREMKKLSIERKGNFWKKIALELERPSKNRRVVNIARINKYANDNEIVVVPGKVLSSGELDKKITVCAYQFSEEALKKININGKALTLRELIKSNPKGANIRIIG
ncbi:MAG: 50S ribosomal protein L18e [Candidatus Woesearchaeota archaeon]